MGTDAWENWRAFEAGANERENFDDELHSDRSFVGGPVTLGPFRLSTIVRGGGSVGPAALLQGGGGLRAVVLDLVAADVPDLLSRDFLELMETLTADAPGDVVGAQ